MCTGHTQKVSYHCSECKDKSAVGKYFFVLFERREKLVNVEFTVNRISKYMRNHGAVVKWAHRSRFEHVLQCTLMLKCDKL